MKEKIKLSGVPETMLQTVYARAKESRGRKHNIVVNLNMKIIERRKDCKLFI